MRDAVAALALLLAACSGGAPAPAPLDTRNEACAHCRMVVSDARFAAQVVAPGEEPRFFDDLGCLRDWLGSRGAPPRRAVAYVADHRTREWVLASAAVYAHAPGLSTPMGSHLVAHRDGASRDADASVAGATPVPVAEILGPGGKGAAR